MYTSSCFLHQFFNSTILKFYSTPLYAIGTSLEHNWQKTTLPTLLYAALNKMLYLFIFLLLICFFLLILLILSLFLLKYSRACIFCCWKCFIHFSIRLLRSCACVCDFWICWKRNRLDNHNDVDDDRWIQSCCIWLFLFDLLLIWLLIWFWMESMFLNTNKPNEFETTEIFWWYQLNCLYHVSFFFCLFVTNGKWVFITNINLIEMVPFLKTIDQKSSSFIQKKASGCILCNHSTGQSN